jgi:DNA repair protein RecO (recombination protein O)
MGRSFKHQTPEKVTGFVVRRVFYGESDLIITLLTLEKGKIDLIARGARSSRKRFEAGLSPYVLYSCMIEAAGNASLGQLKELMIARQFLSVLSDSSKIEQAACGTELIRELMGIQNPDQNLFGLLNQFYENLELSTSVEMLFPVLIYQVLHEAGYEPVIDRCTVCFDPGPAGLWTFSPSRGGIVCTSCGSLERLPWHESDSFFLINHHDLSELPPVPIQSAARIRNALVALSQNILGKTLKSVEIFSQ